MQQRIFHGNFLPEALAQSLMAHFDRGNLEVQQINENGLVTVQIATSRFASAGGRTALSIVLQPVADGVSVSLGEQSWLGIAGNMGVTILSVLRNPFALINRLDDLAQDAESIQLVDEVWKVIAETSRSLGSGFELSEKLKRYVCDYCNTANPPGEPRCIACGAPLGEIQPGTCSNCGYILLHDEKKCPNCGKTIINLGVK
jgi:RNase P subunit RPR2